MTKAKEEEKEKEKEEPKHRGKCRDIEESKYPRRDRDETESAQTEALYTTHKEQ